MTTKLSLILLIGLALWLSVVPAVSAAPPFQEPPEEDPWWSDILPDFDPSELGQDVFEALWGLMMEGLADWIKSRFDETINQFLGFVLSNNWDLKDETGLLGGALHSMFNSALMLAVPWISLSISVTFFQRTLVAVFPGVVKNFSISQHLGRLLIIIFFMNPYMLNALIDVTDLTSSMAFSVALGAGRWDWVNNLISLIAFGGLSYIEITLVVLLLGGLVTGVIVALVVKHLIAFFLLAALPVAAVCWLYPFTEKFWGKFWWMYLKLLAAPFIVAFGLYIVMAILSMMSGNSLIGLLISLLIWGAVAWLLFKFLMMPETWMIAAGGALTVAGAGAVGMPLIAGGVGGYAKRATGDPSTGRAVHKAHQGYQAIQGQVDGGS